MDKRPTIFLVGGGTMGSVSPLLAIAENYEADYIFIGSSSGPEKKVIEGYGMKFLPIRSGKLRRYFSWQNLADIFNVKLAFFQSIGLLIKYRPKLILTAGSFIAVPVAWAGWVLRVPVIVHQQDIEIGLANRVMAPFARKITLTFPEQAAAFNHRKVVATGNPVRQQKIVPDGIKKIVITGGGTGARGLNEFLKPFIPQLADLYPVHHVLGEKNWDQRLDIPNYFPHKFIVGGLVGLLADAELTISRAGMSVISEAAKLKKALILVPVHHSHQEQNASYLAKKNAAIIVHQGEEKILTRYLEKLLANPELVKGLGQNLYNIFPKNAINDYRILLDQILKK